MEATMTGEALLSLIALVSTFAGAVALAYDVLVGFVRRNESEMYRVQVRNFREWRTRFEQGVLLLPSPPYSTEEKQRLLEELRVKYKRMEDEARESEERILGGHGSRAFTWALVGLTMILFGVALQVYVLVAPGR
jgi:hypothetical protein